MRIIVFNFVISLTGLNANPESLEFPRKSRISGSEWPERVGDTNISKEYLPSSRPAVCAYIRPHQGASKGIICCFHKMATLDLKFHCAHKKTSWLNI